jgi:hypothetical protein
MTSGVTRWGLSLLPTFKRPLEKFKTAPGIDVSPLATFLDTLLLITLF